MEDMDNKKLQEPGEQIKPVVTEEEVRELAWRLFGMRVRSMEELTSYDDKNFHLMMEEDYDNAYIKDIRPDGYVMKILNTFQSRDPTTIEAQHAMQKHLRDRGIVTQEPILNREGKDMSLEVMMFNPQILDKGGKNSRAYIVRLVTFIPGTIFFRTPYIPGSFYNIGKFVGRLHKAIKGFHHPFYDNYEFLWSLKSIPKLSEFTFAVQNAEDHKVVEEVITAYREEVIPKYSQLEKSIIHGDINEQNLLMVEIPGQDDVKPEEREHDVCGILDFSDVTYSYKVFDVALSIAYLSIKCDESRNVDVGGHVLAGYFTAGKLNDVEMDVLRTCMCARLAQSLTLGAYTFYLYPENPYVLTTSKGGWSLLHKIWSISKEKLMKRWMDIIEEHSKLS
ncbi:hypothetical protein CHS0354_041190 [Potamilus streckersoni]|uniref:Hydroxylysine kinase n=1 Tax=Potamilus streckersoni TaxID=2493646 RepID=A0AAE0SET2_9BIVA|nr:hypothetical protein CHS0354_041190 [Potamilus streckersoni]